MGLLKKLIFLVSNYLFFLKLDKIYSISNSINPKFESIDEVCDKIIASLELISQLKPSHPLLQKFVSEVRKNLNRSLTNEEKSLIFAEFENSFESSNSWSACTDEQKLLILSLDKFQ